MKHNELEKEVTSLFRTLAPKYGIKIDPSDYEFYGGQLCYEGHLIEPPLSSAERRCLDHAIKEGLNRHTTAEV